MNESNNELAVVKPNEDLAEIKRQLDEARNRLKKLMAEERFAVEFKHLEKDGNRFTNLFKSDKVTHSDFNEFSSQVQKYTKNANETTKQFFKELSEIYSTIAILNEKYLEGIAASVDETNKNTKQIEKVVANQQKIIEKLAKQSDLDESASGPNKNKHYTSIYLFLVAIFLVVLGEGMVEDIFFYIAVLFSISALIAAIAIIPKRRMILKIISIILSVSSIVISSLFAMYIISVWF